MDILEKASLEFTCGQMPSAVRPQRIVVSLESDF